MILLDTQSVIWLNQDQMLLSHSAKSAIAEARVAGTGLAIADITLWEFAMASKRDRIKLEVPLSVALRELTAVYAVLPITPAIAEASVSFSSRFPRDPSDRVIAATALVHNLPLITTDTRIRKSGEVSCIW